MHVLYTTSFLVYSSTFFYLNCYSLWTSQKKLRRLDCLFHHKTKPEGPLTLDLQTLVSTGHSDACMYITDPTKTKLKQEQKF